MVPAAKRINRCTEPARDTNHPKFCVRYFLAFLVIVLLVIFSFVIHKTLPSHFASFYLFSLLVNSSNTTDDHTDGGICEYLKRSANAKANARAAARREPETIVLDEIDKEEDARENGEEGRPIPVQIGHRPCNSKSVLKRQLPNTELDYYPDVYTDEENTSPTKLRTSNV